MTFTAEGAVLKLLHRICATTGSQPKSARCHPTDFYECVKRLSAKVCIDGEPDPDGHRVTFEYVDLHTDGGIVRVFSDPDVKPGTLGMGDVRRSN